MRKCIQGTGQYFQFFRFRSSVGHLRCGERGQFCLLAESIKLIDFTEQIILQDAIIVGQGASGAISYEVLRELPLKDYNFVVKHATKVFKKIHGGEEDA